MTDWDEFESIEEITDAVEELKAQVLSLEERSPVLFPCSVVGCRLSLELAGAAISGKEAKVRQAFRKFWCSHWWDYFAQNLSNKAYEYRASSPVVIERKQVLENLSFFEQHQPRLVNKIKEVWVETNCFHPEVYGEADFFEKHLVGLSLEMAFHLLAGHPDNVSEGLRVVWGYESLYK